jgi:hypothetical protein
MKSKLRPNRRRNLLVRWGGLSVAGTAALAVVISIASRRERLVIAPAGTGTAGVTSILQRTAQDRDVPIAFEDVTRRVGVNFRHFPAERASYIAEDMGSGLAWGDYDGDGYPDLFLVNFVGTVIPGKANDAQAGRSRLYRNVNGEHFEDVTEAAGIHFAGFGMGACWGDNDNDGDLDLYVTAFGDNVFYENLGDGTFRDVTLLRGVQDSRFSSGCSWADYDRDGDLDLYVCNYVDFVFREGDRTVPDPDFAGQPYTLNPNAYTPVANSLFRNNGDGTFTDTAVRAGVDDPKGRSLSASWFDLDNDGWPDLYVANDVSYNGVFRNRGDGTFEDIGASSLAADYRSAMGLAVADFDNDLDLDLFITHWIAQENALYRNMLLDASGGQKSTGGLWFLDAADEFGLGQIALDMVGWGTSFCDFDNDGLRDLWIVNGHTFENGRQPNTLIPQLPFLFWNREKEGFVEVAARACPRLAKPFVGRGGAQADFDRDGRVDLALLAHGEEAILLRNTSPSTGHWLRVQLRQSGGNTFAIGARVYVTSGGVTQMEEIGSSSSYLSQNEMALHFGLGKERTADTVRILWPDGEQEVLTAVPANQELLRTHVARYPVGRLP